MKMPRKRAKPHSAVRSVCLPAALGAALLLCLQTLLPAGGAFAARAPDRWWEEDPLRILVARDAGRYPRREPVAVESLRELREAGFNVYGDRWRRFDREAVERTLRLCAEEGLYYAPWMRGTLGNHDDPDKMIVWSNREVQPLYGPLAPELWEFLAEWVEYYAKMSAEWPLVGVMLDFENYAENKQSNLYASVTYSLYAQRLYAEHAGVEGPPEGLKPEEARQWMLDQPDEDWEGYHEWFRGEFRHRCRELRELADEHNPQFMFISYMTPGLTGEIAAAEWSTDEAPFVVASADYGRRVAFLSERINLRVIEGRIRGRRRSWDEREDVNALVLGGPFPGYRGSDPEYSAKKAAILARDGHGYWVWYARARPDAWHREVMDWYGRANADIAAGTYALADLPRQGPEPAPEVEPRRPEDVQVAVHGDMRSGIRRFLEDEPGFEPHVLQGSAPEYLAHFDLLVLQGTSVPEAGHEEFHDLLRDFVREGGAVALAWNTVRSSGSPFPEIVEGPQPPEAVEATPDARPPWRVRDRRRDVVAQDAAFLGDLEGTRYSAHYLYHMPLVAGPEGTVVTQNRFGMPVIVVGAYGEGRVAAMGDFLGRRRSPSGDEAQTFANVFRYLLRQEAE